MARRTFSITDKEVLNYIDGMDDGLKSRYVVDLIKKDMGKEKVYVTKDEVLEMIKGIKVIDDDSEVRDSLRGLLSGL
jgi:formylmethanofuran dehydrogenase subunit A